MNILLLFALVQAPWVLAVSPSFAKGIRARRWRLYLVTHMRESALLANVSSIFL